LVSASLFVGGLALAWINGIPHKSAPLQASGLIIPNGEKTRRWWPAYKVSWFVLIGALIFALIFMNMVTYWPGFRTLAVICFIISCAALVPLGVYTYYKSYESPPIWPLR
jgi:hypothetical protein